MSFARTKNSYFVGDLLSVTTSTYDIATTLQLQHHLNMLIVRVTKSKAEDNDVALHLCTW